MPASALAARRPGRPWLGTVLVLLGALGFSLGVMLAKMVYAEGASPMTLVMSRAGGFALLLLLVLVISGRRASLPRAERGKSVLLGIVFALQSFCFFTSIDLIPVSLAALTEYTFPLQTAVFMWLARGERLGVARLACFAAALAGLWMALDVSGNAAIDSLDGRGVVLAAGASVLLTVMIVFGNAIMGTVDSRRVTLHTTATVAAVYLLVFALTPLSMQWPRSGFGWGLLAASSLLYLGGMLGLFSGLAMIGPTRASMLANIEPVLIVSLAGPLLGEWLAPGQWFGAALVIGAVFALQFVDRGSREEAATDTAHDDAATGTSTARGARCPRTATAEVSLDE